MLSRMFNTCVLAICFSSASIAVPAQEVVHALSGTINSVNPADKTITVITDDGSGGTFKDMSNSKTPLEFDKGLRAGATPASAFKDKQGRVVVFYFGEGEIRTAVALRDLGPGPFTVTTGTIASFEKRTHSFSIQDKDGTTQSFKIAPSSIADVGSGATEGLKFEAAKGDQVRVVSTPVNGTATAVFVIVLVGL
jgi:hypothetical protein